MDICKDVKCIQSKNISYMGILLHPEILPANSWSILLSDGKIVHGDESEIEVIRESESR